MSSNPNPTAASGHPAPDLAWRQVVAQYEVASWWRSLWQLTTTLALFAAVWVGSYLIVSRDGPWWALAILAVLGGGLVMRLFVLQHDCGHGAFFPSRRANEICGFWLGILTWTPYRLWRWEHNIHHAHAGDLDERGLGAVPTMTVAEYRAAPWHQRLAYRVIRQPVVLFLIAPVILFVGRHRFATKEASRRDRLSVYWTNVGLLVWVGGLSMALGPQMYVVLQLGMVATAGVAGVWLFYVQHQFDGVYWRRHEEWDYVAAALEGSSFYRLPRVLQWFSGNIGFHHIHHLSPRIPNYNLERCHRAEPLFQAVPALTLRSSLRCLGFRLWDEEQQRLVGFGHLRRSSAPVNR